MITILDEPFRVVCTDNSNKPDFYEESEWLHTNDEYIVTRVLRHPFCDTIYYELYADDRVKNNVFTACRFRMNDVYSVN